MPDPAYILPTVEAHVRDKGSRFADVYRNAGLRGVAPVAPSVTHLPEKSAMGTRAHRSLRHRGADDLLGGDATDSILAEYW